MNIRMIGDRPVGPGEPVYVIGEIGINHNGDVEIAKRLVDVAASAGCDAVKFQKRTPDLCVPFDQRDVERDTPWGRMTYIEYRYRVEFDRDQYGELAEHCERAGIHWFASPWDVEALEFLEDFEPVVHKIASASLTDDVLLEAAAATGRPVILSTGMSTMDEIRHAVSRIPHRQLVLMHSTSAYPCRPEELNLRMIGTLREKFPDVPVGYSGHESGLQTTVAAVALGASLVERHITLDRTMWGSDQAASLEPGGLQRLVRDIRVVEDALGDGVKRVYDSELAPRAKLRRSPVPA